MTSSAFFLFTQRSDALFFRRRIKVFRKENNVAWKRNIHIRKHTPLIERASRHPPLTSSFLRPSTSHTMSSWATRSLSWKPGRRGRLIRVVLVQWRERGAEKGRGSVLRRHVIDLFTKTRSYSSSSERMWPSRSFRLIIELEIFKFQENNIFWPCKLHTKLRRIMNDFRVIQILQSASSCGSIIDRKSFDVLLTTYLPPI